MSRIKFKRMTLQYSFLRAEGDEINEVSQDAEIEIREYLKKNYPEHLKSFSQPIEESETIIAQDLADEDEDKPLKETIKKNKDIKKLYHRIAEKTHPDKIGNNENSDLFSQASNAYSEGDFGKLLEIASSLNIKILKLSEESLKILENNIKTLSLEVLNKKNTVGWMWDKASTGEEKEGLIKKILISKGIKL